MQKGWDGWKGEGFSCEKTFEQFSLLSSAELRMRKDVTNPQKYILGTLGKDLVLEDTVHAIASRTTLYAFKYWVEVSGNFSVMGIFEQTFTKNKRGRLLV